MEVTDLVYLLLLDMKENIDYDRQLNIVYGYNVKGINLLNGDYIVVYNRGQSSDWLGLGGFNWMGTENVSVDVYTLEKKNYSFLKRKIWEIFNGVSYEFKTNTRAFTMEKNSDFSKLEYIGANVIKVKVINDVPELKRGDVIIFVNDYGNNNFDVIDVGFVWGIYGNYLYAIKYQSIFCLVRPVRIQDLSNELKKQYRFVMDVEGRIIASVKDYNINIDIDYNNILSIFVEGMKDYVIAEKYGANTFTSQEIELNVKGYGLVEVFGNSSVSGIFKVLGSFDGSNWVLIDEVSGTNINKVYNLGTVFVKIVFTPDISGIDGIVDLVITAKR